MDSWSSGLLVYYSYDGGSHGFIVVNSSDFDFDNRVIHEYITEVY